MATSALIGPGQVQRRRNLASGLWRNRAAGFVMTAPGFILYAAMMAVPLGLSAYLSFTNWNGYSANSKRVGWANYVRFIHDPEVLHAALVSAVIAVVGTIGCNVLGLATALAIDKPVRSNKVFRTIFFYPYVISSLIIGFLWSTLLSTNGIVNSILEHFGFSGMPFLAQPNWALASLICVILWSGFGINLTFYIAGLQTVPTELIEAARVDGASKLTVIRKVTIPMIRPIVTVNIVIVLVGLLRTYELVLALTNGGPAGRTQTMAYLILNESFQNNALGYGSAQSVVLAIVTGALALGVLAVRRRRDAAIES